MNGPALQSVIQDSGLHPSDEQETDELVERLVPVTAGLCFCWLTGNKTIREKNRGSLKRKQTTNEAQLKRERREGGRREGRRSNQVFQFIGEPLRTITLAALVPLSWP